MATPSTIESITVGPRVFTDLSNLIILATQHTGSNSYSVGRQPDGTDYAPSGVAFRLLGSLWIGEEATANTGQILFGDTENGWDTAIPTTPVYEYGAADGEYTYTIQGNGISGIPNGYSHDFLIPDGKFIHVKISGTPDVSVRLYGIEE